ncbi:MAG TPA: M14 family zinc carboxypeptidase, partial [Saprospiraceae bacterium]
MAKRLLFFCLLIILVKVTLQAQPPTIKSPDDFLPYKLGSRVTPHHLLVDYFKYVDGVSDKVQIVQYGMTNELRPLFAAIISTPENLRRIENIRLNNLRRTGMISGNAVVENIAIVYLSYSVHGNEVAGSESAMAVLYDLVKGNEEYNAWLRNTIVIIDPALNPDGYSRYSQWSNSISNQPFNSSLATREHKEPWPGGRFNHYYFDLNRDWVWQMQKESRERLEFYHQWMPHVHADIHEMSHESPYYFAPAAQPYHPNVTKWQADFQGTIGKNHARHFDKEGWRYFTRERFDLFYPSYGDTYATFAGAIGMTYEQGGSGRANRAVTLENGDTLTLADRIAHHRATSLSTIEVSAKHAAQLVDEFADYYKRSINDPPATVRNYVINKEHYPGRVAELLSLLDRNHITYTQMSGSKSDIKGYNYMTGKEGTFTANNGDIVISTDQPKGVLLHVL